MIKRIAAATLSLALLSGAAMAQTTTPAETPAAPAQAAPSATPSPADTAAATPVDSNECLKAASDLAQTAEEKKLGDDKLDKIDDLLTKMEVHCDAKQFSEAMAVAKDIKGVIELQ